jgi:transaldolase
VSIWLDDLSRPLSTSGALDRLVRERHVVGITSSPMIFVKVNAIGGSDSGIDDDDDEIVALRDERTPAAEALRLLTVADVRSGCDVLRPVHGVTDTVDGRTTPAHENAATPPTQDDKDHS